RIHTNLCFLLISIGTLLSTEIFVTCHVVKAQQSSVLPSIPPELSHSTEFVEFLQKAGLTVKEVLHSHFGGMFHNENRAAFIRTNKGVVEVVIFPRESDAEKITITYGRSPAGNVLKHRNASWTKQSSAHSNRQIVLQDSKYY